MVGTKGGGNTSTRWTTGTLYSDGDGRLYVIDRYQQRYFLDHYQVKVRLRQAFAFGDRMRVRVRAKSVPA